MEREWRQRQASAQDTLPKQSTEGPLPVRRTGHAQQQRQLPDNVYGSDPVGTEILTDAAWENLLQDPNPQVSGGQAQLLSLGQDGLCSYDSDNSVFYQDSQWHKLYLELITQEGGDRLLNFFLALARRTPPTGHKASSKPELPDPMYIYVNESIKTFSSSQKNLGRNGDIAVLMRLALSKDAMSLNLCHHLKARRP